MRKFKVLFADLDDTLIQTRSGKTFPQGIWDMELKLDVLNKIKDKKTREELATMYTVNPLDFAK